MSTTITFAALGVAEDLVEALEERGITQPFPIQALTIADAIAGRDVCGKAKTGSGKTLAFGLPILQKVEKAEPKKPRALVLVPTRELALQVHDVLAPLAEARGMKVGAVYGGASMDKQVAALKAGVEIAIATPGRLIDLLERKDIAITDVTCVVLDEADRMADMGFLPQVEWVLRHIGGPHQTLLFSATLDGAVDHLVSRYQRDPVRHEVIEEHVTVDSMVHRFLKIHQMDKAKVVASISRGVTRTIVFVRTKRGADRLAEQLSKEGVKAAAIHGDLRQQQRERALKQFTDAKLAVLVATDVAARGLDVEGIDVVIHYDPAEDHKAYLHRSGRTARAGEAGVAVSLVLWDQEMEIERLQKRLGMKQPLVEIFSNDKRLLNLTDWELDEDEAKAG